MNEEEKVNKEQVDEFTKKALEDFDQVLVENSILNNNIEFQVNKEIFRVIKPSFAKIQELMKMKIKKFNELLKDPEIVFERELKEKLKVKGVDVDAMQQKINDLEKHKKSIQYKLGEFIVNKEADTDLKSLKEEIISIVNEQSKISVERGTYLEFTLEGQLMVFLYSYLAYLITEKKDGENWKKVWNSYQEFENENNQDLIRKSSFYATLVSSGDELGV